MRDKKIIYELCWKYLKLRHKSMRRNFSDKIHEQVNNIVEQIFKEVETFPNLKDNFLISDIAGLFNSGLTRGIFPINTKPISKITKSDVVSFVDSEIFTQPDDFEFFFKFGGSSDFKNGYQLGSGTFHSIHRLPNHVRRFMVGHMPYEREKDHYPTMTKKDWLKVRKRDAYMQIIVKSIGAEKAKQKAFAQMKRNYNIYKLVAGIRTKDHRRPESNFYYCMHSKREKVSMISEGSDFRDNIIKPKFYDKEIKLINKIFNKSNPTDLEQRILNAIDTHGLIEPDTPLHVRFLLCIMGLESLLLGKDDRDYLGLKISEKVSFLLADVTWWHGEIFDIPRYEFSKITNEFKQKHRFESRLKLYDKVKEFYTKRSSFAHSGMSSRTNKITEEDYRWARSFLRWSIETIIPMSKKYTHIAKENVGDEKYLDHYFHKLKFT